MFHSFRSRHDHDTWISSTLGMEPALRWTGSIFPLDGSPSYLEVEQVQGVDVFMHEGFVDPALRRIIVLRQRS